MPRTVLLNNVDHHDLRVITRRGADLGDDVMFAVTFPAEFRHLQAHYPIVLRRTAEAPGFEPVALLGLQEGTNLFLHDGAWDAAVLPLAIERLPFYIGQEGDELLVHIDLDSPRVSRTEGEALFLAHGGSTPFLERASSVLRAIHEGLQGTRGFVEALQACDLIEPFVLDVEHGGARWRLEQFCTVHEERLAALPGAALERLGRAGHLQAAYMVVASMSQFRALIDRAGRAGRPGFDAR